MFLPSLAKSNKDFIEMSHVLLESLWPVNPYLEPNAFITFTYTLASSSATNNNHPLKIGNFTGETNKPRRGRTLIFKTFSETSHLSWYGISILNTQLFVHKYLLSTEYWWSSFFRVFLNSVMRLAIYLTENLPFLAFWSYGVKNSYVDIYKYRVV